MILLYFVVENLVFLFLFDFFFFFQFFFRTVKPRAVHSNHDELESTLVPLSAKH